MFDLIIFNNSTKDSYLFSKLEDKSKNSLYLDFSGLDLGDIPSGEYTYFCFINDREDVEYEFKDVPLNTIIKTGEGNVLLRDLHPATGLLKVIKGTEDIEGTKPIYRDTNTSFTYYKRK